MAKINQDILKEVQKDKIDHKWMKEMEKIDRETSDRLQQMQTFFGNFDKNINKVAELVEKVPDDSVVRPSTNWLNMFGL